MASDAINNIDLYRPGSQAKKEKKAKIKNNLMAPVDSPFDSYTSKTAKSQPRQVKTS